MPLKNWTPASRWIIDLMVVSSTYDDSRPKWKSRACWSGNWCLPTIVHWLLTARRRRWWMLLLVLQNGMGSQSLVKKTEVLAEPKPGVSSITPNILVSQTALKQCENIPYLWSILFNDCSISAEIRARTANAAAVFGRLVNRLWKKSVCLPGCSLSCSDTHSIAIRLWDAPPTTYSSWTDFIFTAYDALPTSNGKAGLRTQMFLRSARQQALKLSYFKRAYDG